MNFKNLRLRSKIIVGIGVPLILALILGGISITSLNSIMRTGKLVEHTHTVIGDAKQIIADAVDMETGMRGYLLAGNEEFLEPYRTGETAVYDAITALQSTVDDNPAQVERLAEIHGILKEWQAQVTEPMIAMRREIGDSKTMNDMADLVGEARGKQYFDRFRTVMAEFVAEEEILMEQRRAAGVDTQRLATGGIFAGVIGALLIGVIVLVVITRSVQDQLGADPAVVAKIAAGIAAGDLSVASDTQGTQAKGVLAAMQQMTVSIQTVLNETNRLIQAVQEGRLDVRGDTEPFAGGWRELVAGVNSVVDAFMAPFNVTAEYLDRISHGDLPPKITDEYQGDFREVTNNVNQCIDAVSGLADETGTLVQAAVEGRLMARGDATQFGGAYAQIIEGMNSAIGTLVGHIDTLPVMVVTLDRDFHIQYINNTGAELAGIPREQILGQRCYKLFHTDDCGSGHCCSVKALQSGTRESGETTSRPEAGREFHASYSSLPIRNQSGEMVGILETVTDQTESKQALAVVERQNWLRTGQAELNDAMRGEQDVATLAKNIIRSLAGYLNAEIGTVYVAQGVNGNTRLKLVASHAYTRRNAGDNTIKIGDGLAGQAAAEEETVLYSEIPDDYLPITTEFGHEAPKHLLVSPFLYQGELKGVIEVGTSGEFSDEHIEFLKQASENIAVTVHSAQTRQEMETLLKQSQR